MLKKVLLCTVCAIAIGLMSACSSVQYGTDLNNMKLTTSENFDSVAHMHADIWGIYLFGLPIFTGSERKDGDFKMFSNTVTVRHAVQLLTGTASAKFKSQAVTDICSTRTTTWLWPSIFFFYKDVQASGNVLK